MHTYRITVRSLDCTTRYSAIAASSSEAYQAAADQFGDAACGITVIPAGAAQ